MGYIKDLLADHETVIEFIRGNINPIADEYGDAGTSNYLTGLMGKNTKKWPGF